MQPTWYLSSLGFYQIEILVFYYARDWASLVAQMVKNLPAMQETRPPSLGWEDPLEKEMATHLPASILAWRIPGTEVGVVSYSLWGRRVGLTHTCTHTQDLFRISLDSPGLFHR